MYTKKYIFFYILSYIQQTLPLPSILFLRYIYYSASCRSYLLENQIVATTGNVFSGAKYDAAYEKVFYEFEISLICSSSKSDGYEWSSCSLFSRSA